MIAPGQHSDKWFQREFCPIFTLAEVPPCRPVTVLPVPRQLRRGEVLPPATDHAMRLVASVIAGTKVEIDGVWRSIRLS